MLIVEHDNSEIILNPLVQIDGDSIKISSTTAYCNGIKINVPSYEGIKTDDIWFNKTKFGKSPSTVGAFKVYDASRTTMAIFVESVPDVIPEKQEIIKTETPIVKTTGLWEKIKNGLKKYL
jgi:hypothetical protein